MSSSSNSQYASFSLRERLETSPYLNQILLGHPEWSCFVDGEKRVEVTDLRQQIHALEAFEIDGVETESIERMRVLKQRFSLLWSIAELDDQIDFADLGRLQTEFAEKSIQAALSIAWKSARMAKLFANTCEVPASESGLFILGLGKLGGNDLNFSSDIDLIAFYDKSKIKLRPMQGGSYAVSQILQQLTTILSQKTRLGHVWRVDWRLRPHASLRNLTMVSDKALDFYHYQARPWHRLAMLKARCVAGEISLGNAFLAELNSFIWRRNLDYRAIDDIAILKQKINLEHPALVQQRRGESESFEHSLGANLKLGHGGIREIEFIVNALQLLWGGRKLSLRSSNTLSSLRALAAEQLLSEKDVQILSQAYVFLRRAENRLQMMNNAQVYHVPDEQDALLDYLKLCNFSEIEQFEQHLSAHRRQVFAIFTDQFSEHSEAELNHKQTYIWQTSGLNDTTKKICQLWEEGFLCYGLSSGQAHHLESLLGALSTEIETSGCEIDEAVSQIDDYFRRLPPGGQYFRLLRDFPWLLKKLIAPVLLSPTMMSLLQQSPHIIDRFLEAMPSDDQALDTTIIFSSKDYENRLENLRRLANEELYLRYSDYFEGKIGPARVQTQLTNLAENLLASCVQVACDEMGLEESPIAVIGFGKLGSRGMMPKSDLDLVYLCASMDEHALATKFASKLNTIIDAPMREGRVYELDTRLRPSGQSGAVTISLDSYYQHQLKRAHTWSHLALVPARFVAGNSGVGQRFSEIKRKILSRSRDEHQFKADCAKMLKRVQDQRISAIAPDQFSIKLRSGGLFELEYLISCMVIMRCIEQPALADASYNDLIQDLVAVEGAELGESLDYLRELQLEIRLFGHEESKIEQLPNAIITHLLSSTQSRDVDHSLKRLESATKFTTSLIETFFADNSWDALSQWKETSVRWI